MALHRTPDGARSVRWFTATAGLEAVGDSVARSLLPIVAVTVLGAGTATVGVINSLGLAAFLLLSLPVGVLADRWSAPRAMMTTSTLARAAVMTAGLLVWLLGGLHGVAGLVTVLAMALVVGVADVGYAAGQGLLVPRLVPTEQIRAVFGRVQSVSQAGGAAGPALLTGVLAVVTAPAAWLAPGLLYLASAATQRGIREPERSPSETIAPPPPPARATMWAQARDGAGLLFAQPLLARITVANTLNNAAVMAANTLLPVIALRELGLAPAVYAAIGTAGALAGIAGATVAAGITDRFGLRRTRVATAAAMSLSAALVMLAGPVLDVLPGPAVLWMGAALGTAPATWLWLALALASLLPCLTLDDPPPPHRQRTAL